ncbi:hypothetical protein [Methanonatronarchaeum sp. AMET-Sl]|uniref:hypothetical protein n=1 Tax=Methanonatronarchaeum sp. AMET-Sl TaxID=3037654 RepID=UPI00244DDC22|nr:hypothetical protein [Methanonatronarchaeum sp. AMET-Sl]WGI17641.1 hypothetical protein QEN48_01125 [Methanonatronarchaeum sp. AMET-Sl]
MIENDNFDPSESRRKKSPTKLRRKIIKHYNIKRLRDFSKIIPSGRYMLSIGSGYSELESKILSNEFEEVFTLEINQKKARIAKDKGLNSIEVKHPLSHLNQTCLML